MKGLYKILILIASVIIVWLTGYVVGRRHFRDVTKMIQTDTLVTHDTIRIERPGEIRCFKSSIPLILPIHDTIRIRDTAYLVLERQIKEYRDSLFYARVSGVEPSLDHIEVYPEVKVISKTETTTLSPSPWGYSITVGMDYGFVWQNYIAPNIGAEFSYKRFTLGAECGMSVDIRDGAMQSPKPYLQMGVKYSIAGR